jgi:hypothetical protein
VCDLCLEKYLSGTVEIMTIARELAAITVMLNDNNSLSILIIIIIEIDRLLYVIVVIIDISTEVLDILHAILYFMTFEL